MKNLPCLARLSAASLIAFMYALLSACGGGGGGGSATTSVAAAGTGSVAILITDAPSDDFDEINVTTTKIELLSDSGRVTVFEGNRTFNLLDLTDAQIFAVRDDVPAGVYSKIRLTVTDIVMVDYNGTNNTGDDTIVEPKLPGNGKLDLNPRGDFAVVAGETLVVQLDMDANKSIHIVQTGNGQHYNFRPVVFIDIVTDAFEERFVKLHGTIENIDSDDKEFDLCDTDIEVRGDDDSRGCVEVDVVDSSSIFDENGMPADFGDLDEGDEATVFGRLYRDRDDDDDEHELDDLKLLASLIELGPANAFQKLDGEATSDVDVDDRFSFDVAAGQGFVDGTELTVQLQDGTRIINREGETVSAENIDTGILVSVRGVLDVNTDTLFASLVLVDTNANERLDGTIGANPDGSCGFSVSTASGDRSVRTNVDTEVYRVSDSVNAGSERISVGDLEPGQAVNVYGGEAIDGCFDADTIISFE